LKLQVNIPDNIETLDIKKVLQEAEVRYGDRFDRPNPLVTVVQGVKEYHFLNCGGLSGFFGKQKSRKTYNMMTVVSAVLCNHIIDGKLKGYGENKHHVWFDTEQARYYTNRIARGVTRKLNLNEHPQNFSLFSLRRYNTEDRIAIIEYVIENTKNIGLVVIDTLSDLVYNINDLNECTALINKLLQLSDRTDCHIACVLHINPLRKGDDEKPRGHLGTELQNRVESSVVIEKRDKLTSYIKPRDFRGEDIDPYGLIINDGIPEIVEIENEEIF